jgi:phage gpG-like protein
LANEAKKIQAAQIRLQKSMKAFVTTMGVEAKNHFVKSFRNQGFTDASLEAWKKRKRSNYRTKGGKLVDDTTRATLVKSGALRRSIKVLNKNYNSITLGSSLPYAQIHNDGLMGRAWGKHSFKMPKRQFIGESRKLTALLREKLNAKILQSFK